MIRIVIDLANRERSGGSVSVFDAIHEAGLRRGPAIPDGAALRSVRHKET